MTSFCLNFGILRIVRSFQKNVFGLCPIFLILRLDGPSRPLGGVSLFFVHLCKDILGLDGTSQTGFFFISFFEKNFI